MAGLGDFSGVIPPELSAQIIQEATVQSAALQLGRQIPMGTKVNQLPVPTTLPTASFVAATTGRKPYSDIKMGVATITAEELAAVIAIPDAMIEDSTINLWNFARPLLAQAIAVALDGAVFFGTGAPASWPAGGIASVAVPVVPTGLTADVILNKMMSQVESQGLAPDGHALDIGERGTLRGLRTTTGELLFTDVPTGQYDMPQIYGLPVAYVPFTSASPKAFTGDWDYLILGVRQDIRYEINPSGVIADASGVVQVSGFQDDVTPMKVWARFGCQIVKPVTLRVPAGANPFASAVGLPTVLAEEPASGSKK
jgi:HK97 family phage major capsid protein